MEKEFLDLDAHRLDHDWSWSQLAEAMHDAGIEFAARTLHYLCKRQPADAHARDRTLHKVRKYLAYVAAAEKRAADRRRRKAAAAAAREVNQ